MMSIYAALFVVKSLMRVLTLSGDGFPTEIGKEFYIESVDLEI